MTNSSNGVARKVLTVLVVGVLPFMVACSGKKKVRPAHASYKHQMQQRNCGNQPCGSMKRRQMHQQCGVQNPCLQPIVIKQKPIFVSQPPMVIKQPPIRVKQPAVRVRNAPIIVEQPQVMLAAPSVRVQAPKIQLERPRIMIEKPQVIIRKPSQVCAPPSCGPKPVMVRQNMRPLRSQTMYPNGATILQKR